MPHVIQPHRAKGSVYLVGLFALILLTSVLPVRGFQILSAASPSPGVFQVTSEANTDCYYLLYSGTTVTNIQTLVQGVPGGISTVQLQDTNATLEMAFYRVEEVSNTPPGLVINEVDYDSVGTDFSEFVELYNSTNVPINLDGLSLVFINGSNNLEYRRQPLSGILPPGGYFVLADSNVVVAAAAQKMYFTNAQDNIQNGAPDGIALFNTATHQLIDSLSYEGAMAAAQISGEGTFNLVEGTALSASVVDSNTVNASLIRNPNGTDSHNDNADWTLTTTVTPGSANVYTP